jgi:hypothetical protein
VIKKTLQILITAALLTTCSAAYRIGFDWAEKRFAPPIPARIVSTEGDQSGPATLSRSAQEARELAARAFGDQHWSASKDLKIRFYDAQRGFWIYAQNYDSRSEKGDRIRFWPIVFIWRGQATPNSPNERRNLIYGGGDEAIIEMSQPLGVIKPDKEPNKIVKAMIRGQVQIRDDKATVSNDDDLEIGPLSDIQFDEPSLSIRSESDVRIKDRDLLITGRGLDIELWPRELMASPTGPESSTERGGQTSFTGTKTIRLASRVRIEVANVGKSDVLPGQSRDKTGQIPAWLQCDGAMRIDLPRQNIPPKVGPPRPASPTIATFAENVVLQRGTMRPDRVTGDLLRAELFPTPKSETAAKSDPKESPGKSNGQIPGGPMTELDLKWARVTGKQVTLSSHAQGLSGVGAELILKRPGGQRADEVYLRGSESVPLKMERVEYVRNAKGELTDDIRSIETMTARDVTVFDEKPKSPELGTASKVASTSVDISTVVARGGGTVEVRDGRDRPVIRAAQWTNQAVVVTDGEGPAARKILTLVGSPYVWDAKSGNLRADHSLNVWLSPRGNGAVDARADKPANNEGRADLRRDAASSLSSNSYEIERVEAHGNVLLIADDRELSAKDRLDVEFLPGTTARNSPRTNIEREVRPTAAWVEQAPAASTPVTPKPATTAKNAKKVKVIADKVWAKLGPRNTPAVVGRNATSPTANDPVGNVELIEARLRGDVRFHQDNAASDKPPARVEAQAVDIVHQGQGAYHLLAFNVDPAATGKAMQGSVPPKPVTVSSDQFDLEGPILGIDQATSTAWVNGPGTIKQWIGSELLKQEGFAGPGQPQKPAENKTKGKPQQATISWKKRMDFFGKPSDVTGKLLDGRAHFQDGIVIRTRDAVLAAGQLDIYFDRPIPLDQLRPAASLGSKDVAQAPIGNPFGEGKPQIQFVDAKRNVTIVNRRRDATEVVQDLQRVEGPRVMYDKARDMVQVDGAGIVRLYQRRENAKAIPGLSVADAKSATKAKKPFNLTRVEFLSGMQGRLGYDPQAAKNEASDRSADFFGNVQVINAQVTDEMRDIVVDKPPADFVFLSSEWLEVESLADDENPKDPRNLIRAKGMATARSATMSTQGDEIHFDSKEQQFHVVGLNGREVTLAHQTRAGEKPSVARGAALVYNNLTGESQLVDPQTIQLIDPNSGSRPGLARSNRSSGPVKPQRAPLRLPPASDKERRSF